MPVKNGLLAGKTIPYLNPVIPKKVCNEKAYPQLFLLMCNQEPKKTPGHQVHGELKD